MTKWEYRVMEHQLQSDTQDNLQCPADQNWLNFMGARGFELVSIMPSSVPGWHKFFFKKEIK